jgi:hypothetical protein
MTRSLQRSKCRRAGCLLCCPWKVTGERPVAERRATQDSVSALVEEALDPTCGCTGCTGYDYAQDMTAAVLGDGRCVWCGGVPTETDDGALRTIRPCCPRYRKPWPMGTTFAFWEVVRS